jgi:hypothetical protein
LHHAPRQAAVGQRLQLSSSYLPLLLLHLLLLLGHQGR